MAAYADCKELFAALSQYLDKELPPGDCAAIEAHIARCAPCVEFVTSLRKTVELCRGAKVSPELPPMPEEIREKLLEAYRQSLAEQR
jgi:RNA polymerase sigma-70 factor (ECF subfamily)